MIGPRLLLPAVLLALASSRATWAGEEPREPPADGALWHARPWPPPPARGIDLSQKEFAEVVLPEAHATWPVWMDEPASARIVINLLPDGHVEFRGQAFELGDEWRDRSLAHLRQAIQDGLASREPRSVALLDADRSVGSGHVFSVLALLGGFPKLTELRISVGDWDRLDVGSLRFRSSPRRDFEGPAAALTHEEGSVRLSIGEASWVFPRAAHLDDPGFVRESNRIWADVRSHLRSRGDAAVSLSLGEAGRDVPFAWVVTFLELARAAGIEGIDLPEAGLRIVPSPAPPSLPRDPRLDDRGPGVLLVVGCVLVVLAAFAVTLLPLRGMRRRSRSGR